jgi:hypothetical protein
MACVAQLAGAGQVYLLIGVLAGNAALAAWRIIGSSRFSARTLAHSEAVASTGAGNGRGLARGMQ